MRYAGYIMIIFNVVLLNTHFLYENLPKEDQWYAFDVSISSVITLWIFFSALVMNSKIPLSLPQAHCVMWLALNHAFDFFQTVAKKNTGSPVIELLIFFVGIMLIQMYHIINRTR